MTAALSAPTGEPPRTPSRRHKTMIANVDALLVRPTGGGARERAGDLQPDAALGEYRPNVCCRACAVRQWLTVTMNLGSTIGRCFPTPARQTRRRLLTLRAHILAAGNEYCTSIKTSPAVRSLQYWAECLCFAV